MNNQIICKELLILSEEILHELRSIDRSKNGNDFDASYRDGARNYLIKVNDLIHRRVEELLTAPDHEKE